MHILIFGLRASELRNWSRPRALRWARGANSTPHLYAQLEGDGVGAVHLRITGGDGFGVVIPFPSREAATRWLAKHASDIKLRA